MQNVAVASLVLGVASLLFLVSPIPIGFAAPVPLIGLIFGVTARNSPRRGTAILGAALCSLTLLYILVSFILFTLFP